MFLSTGWDYFDANEVGFKELYELFTLVTNQLGQQPVVIDADDLLKQPGLTHYFSTSCVLNLGHNRIFVGSLK